MNRSRTIARAAFIRAAAACVLCSATLLPGPSPRAQTGERPAEETTRRRPGMASPQAPAPVEDGDPQRLPRVSPEPAPEPEAVPDRWRLVDDLGYRVDRLDSYQGNNVLKGDRPLRGDEFLSLGAVSGTLLEDRRIPNSTRAGSGLGTTPNSLFLNQSLALDAVLYRGDTVFKPPDWQLRATTVLSASRTMTDGGSAGFQGAAVQALWFEKHLRDVSVHDDFDSARIGIQPLTSDFRGFLLSDQPAALRLFGTRDSNVFQYNLALFRSFRKNAVSLNDVTLPLPRNDTVLANVYWQDFPRFGMTSEFVGAYNRNRERGVQEMLGESGSTPGAATGAPHDYDVGYAGYGVDGHVGRLNATAMLYGLLGNEKQATFTGMPARVQAWFSAVEWSVDVNRQRWRLSLLHASGDDDPRDGRATGFEGLSANPVFAGTDSSYFIHQQLSLAGTAFTLKPRNGLLPTLNAAGTGVQADFGNPGLDLAGIGADWDIAPQWRLSVDANRLWFDRTGTLAALLSRPIPRDLGTELAVNAFWRPFANQNVILRMSNALLAPGRGFRALYAGGTPYSAFVFITLTY